MRRAAGAGAALLVAVTAAVAATVATHAPAGQAATAGNAAAGQKAAAQELSTAPGAVAVTAPGYPDIPAPLPAAAARPAGQARPAIADITSIGSLNWAGYAVSRTKATFEAVHATFFVPYLNCAASPGTTRSSFWVGLDGYAGKPDSVEQIGVGADCSAAGKASYFAWFEMFPYSQTTLPLTVHAGDSVTASVSYTAAKKEFRLSLSDNTRGGAVTKLRKCPAVKVSGKKVTCPRSSAEVIAEAPATETSSGVTLDHLSDYGAVSFAGVSITNGSGQSGGIVSSHWSAAKIIQLRASGGPTLAEPTSVHDDMFDAYWFREH